MFYIDLELSPADTDIMDAVKVGAQDAGCGREYITRDGTDLFTLRVTSERRGPLASVVQGLAWLDLYNLDIHEI